MSQSHRPQLVNSTDKHRARCASACSKQSLPVSTETFHTDIMHGRKSVKFHFKGQEANCVACCFSSCSIIKKSVQHKSPPANVEQNLENMDSDITFRDNWRKYPDELSLVLRGLHPCAFKLSWNVTSPSVNLVNQHSQGNAHFIKKIFQTCSQRAMY